MFVERECISLGFVNLQIMAYYFPTKIYIKFSSGQVVVVEEFIEFVEEEFLFEYSLHSGDGNSIKGFMSRV